MSNFLPEKKEQKFVSIQEAARILGVSTKTLRRWDKKGILTSYRTQGDHRRYPLTQITNFKEQRDLKPIKRDLQTNQKFSKELPVLFKSLHSHQKRALVGLWLGFLLALNLGLAASLQKYQSVTNGNKTLTGKVLQAATTLVNPRFFINIPTLFRDEVTFEGSITSSELATFTDIEIDGTLTLAGALTVPEDLTVNGDITSTATTFDLLNTTTTNINFGRAATTISLGATTGTTTINNNLLISDNLTGINGVTYSFPSSQGSSSTFLKNNGSGTLTWSTVTADLSTATGTLGFGSGGTGSTTTLTAGSVIFSDGIKLTQDNTNFFWNDTDNILRIGSGAKITPSVDLGADLGTASLRWNNIYAANLTIDSGFTSSGQLLVTYNPADTTFAESSIRINVTTPAADEQMLGIGQAGEERSAIDAEGDLTIGYDGIAGSSIPTNSNPLSVYGHNTTEVFNVTAAGNVNFTGKLLEDGNEIFASVIAPFASSCPTGWTEYTAARGRTVVGNPSGGTVTTTQGTAFTADNETRTITDVPAHTHAAGTLAADSGGAHTHPIPITSGGSVSTTVAQGTTTSAGTASTSSGGAHTHTVSGSTASTGSASVDVTMPYIQLTYCQKTAGADYAEWIESKEKYEPGTIVSADPEASEQIKITEKEYDSAMLGIIATSPGWTVGQETKDSLQLALAGRVPVKIASSSAKIKVGDFITSSPEAGKGMKAIKAGYVVGKALEDWSPDSNKNEVLVFANLSFTFGSLTPNGYINTGEAIATKDVSVENNSLFSKLLGNNQSATPSAQISTDPASVSISQALEKILGRLENTESEIILLKNQQLIATSSASLADVNILDTALLSDTVVNGTLNIGTIQIDNLENSIDAIGILKIQPLALGNLEFMNDYIEIDTKGNLNIKEGVVIGNNNFRSSETLPAGEDSLHIERTWDSPPTTINLTPNYNTNIWVSEKSETGFVINVDKAPLEDAIIDWLAIW